MSENAVTAQWIPLAEGDGPEGYLALPEGRTALGAVLVGGEMFGVPAHVRDICHRLAAQGYAALAPNYYWRHVRRPGFGYEEPEYGQAMALMKGLRADEVLADVAAARTAVQTYAGDGGTAILGFSIGGHIALLGATELPFDLVVNYYGGWLLDGGIPLADPVPPVAKSEAIAAHTGFVLGFFGADDFVMSLAEWHRVGERLTAAHVAHEQVTYSGVGHGFFNDERPDYYDAKSAEDSWRRTLEALTQHVRRG
jgi:carboxymethylenebutenolidase